ncbi:hypothetical protein ACFQFC_25615 [Amorphoplanes digitatis]|uniref:Uncharacterized protein n=1 Tax=Actinoplanes digitatis TaxID=1868 RepID=A0A7W7MM02_9ACTN|nr:hypothetical protein [Actinoplanes digitatis]MBB4759516.1 hypothetical protein [Actinoplanes digitatis]BFE67373.1 hypothetical protein GCM10020092_006740 [Actinoplanes digitatis]GID94912.1 hypothetical protein Adi01nite_43240 [Actinoplanes digitatis]
MGSLSDNGGNWPPDGGSPDGLPDLPEEWGVIVIPDDLSELSDEVTAVRDELRRSQRQSRWQRFAERPGMRTLRRAGAASLRAPVLIISMAVLVTVASLFASAWPGPARSPATQRTATTTDDRGDTLPALELIGADGRTVPLRGQLPAVVLLTDGCECDRLVADTAAAVKPEIAVVTVVSGAAPGQTGGAPPTGATPQPQGTAVRALRDPTGELRAGFEFGPPDGTAAALLVNRGGEIVRKVPRTVSIEDLRPDLARL